MTAAEGVKTFQCVLALKDFAQVVISAGDLHSRIRQWIKPAGGQNKRESRQAAKGTPPEIAAGDVETVITRIWLDLYRVESVDKEANFFDLGATSLDLIQIHGKLIKTLGRHMPFDVFLEYPTIRSLSEYLRGEEPAQATEIQGGPARESKAGLAGSSEVAVIGMAGRFPGAGNTGEFWENLVEGRETISFFSDQELQEAGLSPGEIDNPGYIKAKGFLAGTEYFDAGFFDYAPGDAEIMDPQMRIFHECVWEALEDAGYDPKTYPGSIGLYGGATPNLYWEVLSQLSRLSDAAGQFSNSLLYDKDSLATQVSYKLDLKGPSLTLFTGCSTSLVAIASAYRALVSGQCHMAAAGGVTVTLPEKSGYIYQAGMLFSADGHCRSFDAKASGMIFGDGAGVVVLKPLPEAIRDGDNIHAVIKGSAVNNDGSRKIGYTSPSVKGQVEVIKAAHHLAGIEPESIAYVETHGTGTILGDPIEINALTQAFNTGKKHFCPIGSVKSNTGHMMCASGVAGFIKTILSLKYHLIPPSLNFAAANPQIDFANSPFYVNTTVSRWESNGTPLRAGVSSFGIGGTNAHLILEQAPELPPSSGGREGKMFLFSAKTETALERTMARFAGHLEKNPGIDLADAAYTLQVGRRALNHRAVLVCSTREEVIEALLTGKSIKVKRDFPRENRSKIVFMFAGQGAQYVEMGRELYEKEPVFREALEQGFAWVKRYYGSSLKELLYPHSPSSALPAAAALAPTAVAQPVIFIFEYALARLLMKWGIQPWAMIGYSFGEYVAAHLAGVFSLEDAIKLIVRRGELMNRLPPGAMLSVPLPEDRLKPVLEECALPLSLAIDNGSSCIVAGSQEVVEVFQEQMKQKKLMCFRVPIAHAAHSLALDTILEEYEQHVGTVTLNKPGIPLISNITGTWLTPEQAVSPAYWVQHLRETVRFARGLEALIEEPGTIFLEIGPGRDLSVIVNRFLGSQPHRTVHTIRQPQKKVSDVFFLLNKIAHLWACGVKIDWNGFYDGERRYRISLPPYPFEGQRYRLKGNPLEMVTEQLSASRPHRREAIDDWFYFPSWKRVPLAPPTGESEPGRSGPGWLFINHRGCRLSSGLKNLLESKGHQVTTVEPGTCLERLEPGRYRLNPQQSNDYIRLVEELGRRDKIPGTIVHLWSVFDAGEEIAPFTPKDLGFYSLLYLAQAIGGQNITTKIEIIVVSSDMQEVTGGDLKCPAKATLLGPCQVIPREYPQISCRSIDIVTPGSGGEPDQEAELSETINHLFKEFSSKSPERPTAYRNNYRWLQTFEPISLREVPPSGLPVKQGGVYLITGGLGGIGFSLARHLAQAVQAKLILTGRSGFPAKEEWEQWVALHRQEEPLSRKVRDLMELEAQGAEILVFSTDVTDRQQMGEVISRAEERLGPIDGVIHAAGVPGGGMIQIKKKSAAETVFAPKITGTLVLDDIFRGRALDFFIICSSTASFLGLFGQVDYTGANAFLDAFAFYRTSRDGVLTTAINWYDWQEVGMAVEAARQYAGRLDISLEEGIRPAEGIEAFNRVLVAQLPQVVVAPKDLDLLIKESDTARRVKNRLDHLEQADRPVCRHRRPDLDVPYREPRGEIQQVLANTLQEFLGIENVGIHDDFFDLGGDSLKAISVVSRIHKELNVEIPLAKFFQVPTVELLAGYIGTQEQSRYSSMEAVEEKEYYRLSSAQKRLYVIYQINPLSTAYNEFFAVSLEGALDRERVKGALIRVLKRHESFRTSFEIIADEPIQKIHSQVSLEVEYIDLAAVMTGDSDTGPDRPGKAKTLIKNFIRPFELARAPILRVGLIRQGYNRHILMIDLHHIITDGVSDNIFVNDFMVLYSGGEPPPLRVQYKDYAEWQRTAAQREVMARQESYWLNRFTGRLPVLDLPTDFARPLLQSFEGSWLSSGIGRELTGKIKTLALEKETTLYIVLLAVYTILLSKYTGQADIIVGSPITGRIHTDVQNTIGMFVNMLAMRSFPVESKDFSAFLAEVKENSLQAFENQQYQFEELVIKLGLQGKTSRNPLFDVVFALQNMGMGNVEINDLKVFPYESEIKGAQFDFLLIASETGDTIDLILEFSTALFKKATMEKFLQRYIEILQQVVDSREIKLADLQFSRDLADIAAVSPEAEAGDFGF
jgi:acyl transferase domain-containing protein/acyl carrier protein